MKHSPAIPVSLSLIFLMCTAWIPPDLYDEDYSKSIGFWENHGQIVGTDGLPRADVKFYSEGGFPRAYLQDKSRASFVVAVVDTDAASTDTLYRLDIKPHGARANEVDPQAVEQKDWLQNFYMAHCGANGVAGVLGYSRVIYEKIFPNIDWHFYSGSKGQKMAFVLRPGCDPADLKLALSGQDSLGVDLWGNLKVYLDDKWIVMPFAQAYQVNGNGNIIPVSWTANYQVDNGTGVVGFTWSSYNAAWPLVFQIGIPPFGPTNYDEEGLCWSTYIGGDAEDLISRSTQDEAHNYYVTGQTLSTFASFPISPGTNYAAIGWVSFAIKFDETDNIVWKTFVGGSQGEQTFPTGIVTKPLAGVYLYGNTDSESLLVFQQPGGLEFYQPSATGPDFKGFIFRMTRLTGEREWLTYFGNQNLYINDGVVVSGKKLFIAGSTYGLIPSLDVAPPTGSTFWDYQAFTDGYVGMLNDYDQFAWRTYLPGSYVERALDVSASATSVVVSGSTYSPDMHTQSNGISGCFSVGQIGVDDCFANEFTLDGAFIWGTYIGTTAAEYHRCAAVDPTTGDVVIIASGGADLDVVEGPGWFQSDPGPIGTTSRAVIARFAGSNRALTWHSYLHNGEDSNLNPDVCTFDGSSNLFIGGGVNQGTGLLLQPFSNFYQQNEFQPDSDFNTTFDTDGLMLCFGPENVFLWGTYFGGQGYAGAGDRIKTILRRNLNGHIYVAGFTSKYTDPLSYFPLDDGGGGPYFTYLWQGGFREGFITAFCGDGLVGVSEHWPIVSANDLGCTWINGTLVVHRPSLRPDRFEICDALGRRVSAGETVAGYPLRIELASLASGAYVFRTSAGTGRFVVLDSRAMRLLFSWVLLHCAASGFAQWVPAGVPFRIFEMGNIHKDTITDALYFCGESSLNNDFDVSDGAVPVYTNGQWDTLGVFGGRVQTIARWNDTLVAGGPFAGWNGDPLVRRCAYWDSAEWKLFGDFSNSIYRLKVISGELYAIGAFIQVDGQPCQALPNAWTVNGNQLVYSTQHRRPISKTWWNGTVLCTQPE